MSGHTPGPWTRVERVDSVTPDILIRIPGVGTGTTKIATLRIKTTWGGNLKEQRANAHLIAAAPDLLEACNSAQRFLRVYGIPDAETPLDILVKQLAAALAKAEGK